MEPSIVLRLDTWQLILILLALMIISIMIGLIVGKKFHKESQVDTTILGSLLTLLGLLLAFTFSMAINYHGMRKDVIIQEANDIGTAILRADLYRDNERNLLRAEFKKYVDARVDYFNAGTDLEKVVAAQKLSVEIQQQLWDHATKFSKDSGYVIASMQMIPALNSMIDITTTRQYGNFVHLPDTITYLLFLLSCVCSFYIGYMFVGKKRFDWVMAMIFCLLTSLVVFVIFDLDRPRRGFIKLDQMNNAIVELKQMFPEK
ncbi:MAG TPA: hypothetical protein VNM35_03525 [Chitinophagaceae bacterium]|jgi:hypothetical protein|nr:hypothetical protein [Chitinophagaceae bacterium]